MKQTYIIIKRKNNNNNKKNLIIYRNEMYFKIMITFIQII